MKKRIISMLLSAAMLLATTACGNNTPDEADTTDTTALTENLPIEIEQQNYNGNINILMPAWGLYVKYFDPGDDKTDIMNKALYNREMMVEEYLGVNITYDYVGNWEGLYPALKTVVSTNDDLYQFALNHCTYANSRLITEGLVFEMNELDIDFTGDWFNHNANEAPEVAGKQFFCVSEYMLPDPNAFLFNKDLIARNNLEDPYQLVRDGKWTIDKLAEMSAAATVDNGDTVWDEKDTYGFACPDNWYNVSFLYGADVDILTKSEDGILPYPKLDEEQEDYISNDWTGLICVPMSLNEESYEMVGDVIELLSYYSEEDVIPAYIDITLGTKLARDTESKEMLEIIFDRCTFDPRT